MKRPDSKNQKKKSFLHIPTYPGGKQAYMNFINENIVYPESARENNVGGDVYIRYTVNNIGEIVDVDITKGIGYGCDEEAERVIRLMKYEPARNRGVKMKVEMKTRITFNLPGQIQGNSQNAVQYNYTLPDATKNTNPEPKPQAVYNYSINLG